MIARRAILTGTAALTLGAAPVPRFPDLRFEVLRNGGPIGQHTIRIRQDGTALEAAIDVDIVVRVGPIVLYRYALKARESWRDGAFASMESETNDDGTRQWVKATQAADHVAVEASGKAAVRLPANALPLTHWNILCMERPLFDPQDGTAVQSSVQPRGEETVPLADGRTVRATRYALIGKVALDNWYDTARHWTALRAPARDGSTIEYRRVA